MDFMVSPGWKLVIYNSGPNRENFGALLNSIIGPGLTCKSVLGLSRLFQHNFFYNRGWKA